MPHRGVGALVASAVWAWYGDGPVAVMWLARVGNLAMWVGIAACIAGTFITFGPAGRTGRRSTADLKDA